MGVDLPDLPLPQELAGYTGGDVSFLKEDFELQLNKQIVLDTVSVFFLGGGCLAPCIAVPGAQLCPLRKAQRQPLSHTHHRGTSLPGLQEKPRVPLGLSVWQLRCFQEPFISPNVRSGPGCGGQLWVWGGPGLGTIGDGQQPVLTRLRVSGEGATGRERHHSSPAVQGLLPALQMAL